MIKFTETWSEFILNESLKTHDIDITFSNVKSELSLLKFNFDIKKNINNSLSITLNNVQYIYGIVNYINVLNRLLVDRHGWFPTKMEIKNISGMLNEMPYNEEMLIFNYRYYDSVKITYEAKYDIELNLPKKLYHLSIKEYESNVLKNGLVPKSKSKLSKHLDRIYVCSDIKDCYNLINRMKFYYDSRKINNRMDKINNKWVIYEIDTDGLDIKLFKDPNYENGYYIIDNISKNRVKIVDSE
jgi:hypothetical protein